MNHIKVLKESYILVLKHRYLWFLGLLLGAGSGVNLYNFGNNNSEIFKQDNPSQNIASLVSANVKDAGQVLSEKISANMSNMEWAIATVSILLIIIALIYLNITAKGAATWAISELHGGAKFNFSDAWNAGHKYFWRRLSYGIVVGASILVSLAVLATPVILLAIFELIVPAIIVGTVFGLAFCALVIYLSLFLPYSERTLFLDNKKTFKAVFAGYKLFNKNWVNLLLMYLILFAIGIVVAIGLVIALLLCGLLAFGIGAAFYFINHIAGYAIGGLIGLALFLACLILNGALQSFNWAVITLSYKEVR